MVDETSIQGDRSSTMSWALVAEPETLSVEGSMVDISGLRITSDNNTRGGPLTDDISSIQMGGSHSVASSIDGGSHHGGTLFEETSLPLPPAPTHLESSWQSYSSSATICWQHKQPLKADSFVIERGKDEADFVPVYKEFEPIRDEDTVDWEASAAYYYWLATKDDCKD